MIFPAVPRTGLLALTLCLQFALFAGAMNANDRDEALDDQLDEIRFNQIQVIGTHNSYHIAAPPPLMRVLAERSERLAQSLDYTHRPLEEQFSQLGVRQIELDVFADPDGGLYQNPLRAQDTEGVDPPSDPDGALQKPGLKVLHVQDIDFGTTTLTFKHALVEIRDWLRSHPESCPITVLVEVKQSSIGDQYTQPHPFGATELDSIDEEILSVFDRDEILKPDDVRGDFSTLRDAVLQRGWPRLNEVRGKVLFALDNGGQVRDQYLAGHPSLAGRMLFVSTPADHPAAAFMKINDPVGNFAQIQDAVKQGFIVRTRADSGTRQSRRNDTSRRDRALASGAQFVSTDYPEPDRRFSDYEVRLPNGVVARVNPVNSNAETSVDLDHADRNKQTILWPMWRGRRGDGVNDEANPPLNWSGEKNIAWKTAIAGVGHSSPIVCKDSVFLTTADLGTRERRLVCVDRATGEVQWNRVVTVADIEVMHNKNSPASGTPAADSERVYVIFQTNDRLLVAAYDHEGDLVWKTSPGSFESRHGFNTSLVLFDDSIIVSGLQDGREAFVARLNKFAGDAIWKTPITDPIRSFSTPLVITVAGNRQIVLSGANRTSGYDARDGRQIWTVVGPAEKTVSSLSFDGDLVFVAGGRDNQLLAISPTGQGDVTRTHVRWQVTRGVPYVSSPLLYDGVLHVLSDEGVYTRINPKSGKTISRSRLLSSASSSPVAARGRIYFTDDQGMTVVLSSKDPRRRLARNDIGEPVFASMALVGPDLFLRGREHLYCIRRPTAVANEGEPLPGRTVNRLDVARRVAAMAD